METRHPRTKALLILVTSLLLLVVFLHPVHAVSDNYTCKDEKGNTIDDRIKLIKVAIPIPGFTHQLVCLDPQNNNKEVLRYYYVKDLSTYLSNLYQYFVGIVGILAAVMIMYGGIRWILAAGNQSRIQGAKNVIFSAIIGVVIAFSSYLLLYLLNPRTVDYETLQATLDVNAIKKVGDYSPFCADFENPADTTTNPATYDYYFHLIKPADESGNTSPNTSVKGSDFYCGDSVAILQKGQNYEPGDKTGLCYGTKCSDSGKVCVQVNAVGTTYDCESQFLKGHITWPIGTNAYVDYITLVPLCINGKEPGGGLDQGGDLANNISEEADSYSFPFKGGGDISDYALNLRLLAQDCERVVGTQSGKKDLDYFAGFYLNVEVNDDTGWVTKDDNYAVGNNSKPLSGINWSKKSPGDITQDEWKQIIANHQLIPWSDFFYDPSDQNSPYPCYQKDYYFTNYDKCLLKSKELDLNITRDPVNGYPAR